MIWSSSDTGGNNSRYFRSWKASGEFGGPRRYLGIAGLRFAPWGNASTGSADPSSPAPGGNNSRYFRSWKRRWRIGVLKCIWGSPGLRFALRGNASTGSADLSAQLICPVGKRGGNNSRYFRSWKRRWRIGVLKCIRGSPDSDSLSGGMRQLARLICRLS